MRGLRAALLLAVGLSGCRQVLGLDEREVGATNLTAENYVSAVARALCAELEPCCSKYGYGFKDDACERIVAGFTQTPVSEARSLGLVFDAGAADKCVRATITLARLCEPTVEQYYEREAACNRVYRGTKAPGEPCQADVECAFGPGESPTCSDDVGGAPSFCTIRRRGVEGDDCRDDAPGFTFIECPGEDGLRCDLNLGRCVRQSSDGSPCTSSYECFDAAYCRLGVCVAKGGPGAECAPLSDSCFPPGCDEKPCAAGLYCDAATRTCAVARPWGEACERSEECGDEAECRGGRCEPEDLLASVEFCGAPRR
jgi:hypothetical protein